YSPIDPVVDLIERKGDRPPEEVMPEVAVLIFRVFERNRGFLRALALEVTSLEPDTRQAVQDNIGRLLAALGGYILAQMAAGRLGRLARLAPHRRRSPSTAFTSGSRTSTRPG